MHNLNIKKKVKVNLATAKSIMSFRFLFLIYMLNIISLTHII
jgi:hypothetical protein